jgi:tetratricopeptide (TPR) repeat protein
MSDSSKKWIIRDTVGRISGPFTTEKILHSIGQGEFTGEESIAYYPGGAWISISQDPQFYDKLLDSLSNEEHRVPTESSQTQPDEPKTEIDVPEPPRRERVIIDMENTVGGPKMAPPPPTDPPKQAKKKSKVKRKTRPAPRDIELIDTKIPFADLIKDLAKHAKLPGAVALVGGLLIWLLFSGGDSSSTERIHLLAPQKGQAQESADAVKGRVKQGVSDFLKDTFESYISAQNNLVRAIEGNGKDPEVMALLCMTYLELWPYAYQDSSDLKTVSSVVQVSSAIDPGGINSAVCRSVDLIVRGRYSEAKSLTEAMLESRANQASPPIIFYYLKGLLLEGTGDYATAVGYFHSAEQLWQAWTKPYILDAQTNIKMEKYSDAANILRRVLAGNHNHVVAMIELGILEYKYFNHPERGQELLEGGVSGGAAPKETLSRAYLGLAEIVLKGGSQNKALKYAKKAYSLNSSNGLAKNLIVRLGGMEGLRGTKVKGQQLIFEGDQFFREGDCNSAQAYYKYAYEEDGHNAVAAMKAAQCLWRLSFSTEALDWLNKAIKADPKLIEAYVLMADYLTLRYNFLAATKILAVAYKINPKSPDVFRGFALIELRRDNYAGAIGYAKKALQIYETDVETQILIAQAYLASKDYKLAYNYAAKAIEIDVNHRHAQTVYAEALMGLQGVDVAIDYLLKLIASYPLVIDYRLALGKLYEKDERYEDAEEVFSQIAKIEDKPKEAYIELAKVLKAKGQLNAALEFLLKAAVLDPADAQPLFEAGLIYLDTGRGQDAITQFERVLRTNKMFPLVHYQMGRAALIMRNPEKALEETRQEKVLNPNLADSYLLAAEAHAALGQFTLCATEYQRAIKLRPQVASIYVHLAQCYRQSGNLEAAGDMLAHAANQEQGLADIYKEQGAIYEVKGEVQHAIEAYNQYFVLDPNAPDRPQIEARIQALQRSATSP